MIYSLFFRAFFFFQAEDGIRDIGVTGVQTCALPILSLTLAPVTVAPSFGSTILNAGAADSCSPRSAIWSLAFCGRSTCESDCAAGVADAAAFAFEAFALFAFMSEEQAANVTAAASTQETDRSRESFI